MSENIQQLFRRLHVYTEQTRYSNKCKDRIDFILDES